MSAPAARRKSKANADQLNVLTTDKAAALLDEIEGLAVGAEYLSDGLSSFQQKGQVWLSIEGYYAQAAVQETMEAVKLPLVNSTHCLFVEGRLRYLRVSLLKAHSSILILKATDHEQDETDALIDFILTENNSKLNWPGSEDQELEFFEYFALMKSLQGSVVYDRLNRCGVQLAGVFLREVRGTLAIMVSGNVLIPHGKKMMAATQSSTVYQFEKCAMSAVRFVPLSAEHSDDVTANADFAHRLCHAEEPIHVLYKGVGYIPAPQDSLREIGVKSRVVIDPEGCHQTDPDFMSSIYSALDYSVNSYGREPRLVTIDNVGSRQNVVSYVIHYDLKGSRWFCGLPSRSSAITFNDTAFDELVLEEDTKELIHACVLHRNAQLDGIAGKDTGALFLLSGEPGTGKTLCAESLAELLKKPLYKVGMGELGTTVQDLDDSLHRILGLAERWKAILLIDEADAFMTKRGEDLERNALVAVALKHFEYAACNIVLTTNLIENIDKAFMSRVTMAIHFPEPTQEIMAAIWKTLLSRAGFISGITAEGMDKLLSYQVNGREIKNTCSTAMALAAFRQIEPGLEHLVSVLDKWKVFESGAA